MKSKFLGLLFGCGLLSFQLEAAVHLDQDVYPGKTLSLGTIAIIDSAISQSCSLERGLHSAIQQLDHLLGYLSEDVSIIRSQALTEGLLGGSALKDAQKKFQDALSELALLEKIQANKGRGLLLE
jgi:hypothetical protein